MKKTLAAVAVLGAFAGSALAADLTLYGCIDTGLNYTSNSIEENGVEKVDEQDWVWPLVKRRVAAWASRARNKSLKVWLLASC